MGHIYYELPEIEVPKNSRPDGDRVYVIGDRGRGIEEKIYIGVYARKDECPQTFYPNERFRQRFPNLWEKCYGKQNLVKHVIGIGIYALTLGIGHLTKLYPIVDDAFGPGAIFFLGERLFRYKTAQCENRFL